MTTGRSILISFLISIILLVFYSCSENRINPVAPEPSSVWRTSTPEEQNVNSAELTNLTAVISNGIYGNIKSLVITRNNTLIWEKYFNGASREQLHIIYSVTKSVTSALVGIALEQNKITSLHNKLLDYFSEYSIENQSASKSSITLRDAITMSAGFQWNELSIPYADPYNDFNRFYGSSRPEKYLLDKPMAFSPGTHFTYNTGLAYLFADIIKKTMKESAEEMAVDYIFTPLGIKSFSWYTSPDSITNTGNGLSLRAIDMALFGQLYLNKGTWNGTSLIPSAWIDQSTSSVISDGPDYNYGYFWWRYSDVNPLVRSLTVNDIFVAIGYGGQRIFVIPQFNMVIITTADNDQKDYDIESMLSFYIFPSIKDK